MPNAKRFPWWVDALSMLTAISFLFAGGLTAPIVFEATNKPIPGEAEALVFPVRHPQNHGLLVKESGHTPVDGEDRAASDLAYGSLTYHVLFVGECLLASCPMQDGFASFLSAELGHTVRYLSSDQIAAGLSSGDVDLTEYDFVFWHYSSPDTTEGSVAREITYHNIPTIIIDGEGFPLSKSLGLVAPNAGGATRVFGENYSNEGIYAAHVEGYGNDYHFLLHGDGFLRFPVKESAAGLEFGQPFQLDPQFEGYVHTVSLGDSEQTNLPYTRPILAIGRYDGVPWGSDQEEDAFYIDLDNVVALVDDRRRIVASGLFDWKDPYLPYEPSESPEDHYERGSNRYWDFLYRMVTYVTSPSPSTASIGQNTFTETDLVVPSVGFDFAIRRTYTSGAWNLNSYQSPSWTSNHDQYLIWDKYNDRIHYLNGTGRTVEMELVQGDGVKSPAAESNSEPPGQRTFVSVSGGVTDIAVYFPPENLDPLTWPNPLIGDFPQLNYNQYGTPYETGVSASELCTAERHPTHHDVTAEAPSEHQSGFLIRDRHNNLAFFAYHPINETPLQYQSDQIVSGFTGIVGDRGTRTRGGEMGFYRLAYIQDANGNRQNYYYAPKESEHNYFHDSMPEDLLWCVVDTEGRGYYFDTQWTMDQRMRHVPWIRGVDTPEGLPDVRYEFASLSLHGLLLHQVEWYGDGQSVDHLIGTKKYGYWFIGEEGSASSLDSEAPTAKEIGKDWDFIPPLRYVTDRSGRVVQRFEYEAARRDSYLMRLYRYPNGTVSGVSHIHYPGKLSKATSGLAADETETRLYYHLNPGVGNREDLTQIHGSVTTLQDRVAATVAFNARYHTIKHLQWHLDDPDSDTDMAGAVRPCVEWDPEDSDFQPILSCPGSLWAFRTNYDGQVVEQISPLGIVTERRHMLDSVTAYLVGQDNSKPIESALLEFWRHYWHLRPWLSNEVSVKTLSSSGDAAKVRVTKFDPVFNRPTDTYSMGVLKISQRYDYMEDGHWFQDQGRTSFGISDSELFKLMHIPHAVDNDLWPDFLTSCQLGGVEYFETIPWLTGSEGMLCNRENAPIEFGGDGTDEPTAGNVVCKILPDTEDAGESAGCEQAAAVYGYDHLGRQIYFRTADGRETLQQYRAAEDIPPIVPNGALVEKLVREIDQETGHEALNRLYYDAHGSVIASLRSVDSTSGDWVYHVHDYDSWARVIRTQSGRMSSPSNAVADKEEEFLYDANGNLVATVSHRCLDVDDSGCADSNLTGDTVRHLWAFDTKGRVQVECNQLAEQEDEEIHICIEYLYNQRDLLESEKTYSECTISTSVQSPESIQAAVRNALDAGTLEVQTTYYYNDQNLLYREVTLGENTPSREVVKLYDSEDRIIAIRDPEGVWTHREYDGFGRLVRETQGLPDSSLVPDGQSVAIAYEYDAFDHVVRETFGHPVQQTETDAAFGETESVYDRRGQKVAVRAKQYTLGKPEDVSSTIWTYYSYNQNDQVEKETVIASPSYWGSRWTQFDGLGRVAAVVDDFSHTSIEYDRDDLGRVVRETRYDHQEDGQTAAVTTETSYTYNSLDDVLVETEIDPLGLEPEHSWQYSYDGLGYLIKSVDAKGQTTSYVRDGSGNPVIVSERFGDASIGGYWLDGEWTTYQAITNTAEYDYAGRIVTRRDAHGQTTRTDYNAFGETELVVYPDGSHTRFVRNNVGAVTRIDYSDGRSIRFVLNRFAHPTAVSENGSLTQFFSYFGNGAVKYAVDWNPGNPEVKRVAVSREWDTMGNLLQDSIAITDQRGTARNTVVAEYEYGRLTELRLPASIDSNRIHYVYDRWHPDQLRAIEVGREVAARYEWAGGRLIRREVVREGSDLITHRVQDDRPAYDGFGNVSAQHTYLGTWSSVEASVDNSLFTYNENDRLLSETNASQLRERVAYGLDGLDRVTDFREPMDEKHYNLDAVNNIRQTYSPSTPEQITNLIISENGLNQITATEEANGEVSVFEYDSRGNLVRSGDREYVWDVQGRLVEVREDGSPVARYAYDALNRRVRKAVYTDSPEVVDFHMFGGDVVEEEHVPQDAAENRWLLVILHDPTRPDNYLRWDRYERLHGAWSLAKSFYPVADIRNNVVAVVDSYDSTEDLTYDLFGNEVQGTHTAYIPYRFSGRRYDEETDLYYYRTRYYYPRIARFISIDSSGIWGDPNNMGNGYAYVGNMANSLADPFALASGVDQFGRYYSTPSGSYNCLALENPSTKYYPLYRGPNEVPGWFASFLKSATKELISAGLAVGSALKGGNIKAPATNLLLVASNLKDAWDLALRDSNTPLVLPPVSMANETLGDCTFKKATVLAFGSEGKIIILEGDQEIELRGEKMRVRDGSTVEVDAEGKTTGPYYYDPKTGKVISGRIDEDSDSGEPGSGSGSDADPDGDDAAPTDADKDDTAQDRPADGEEGVRPEEILAKVRRALLTGGGVIEPGAQMPYMADIIQTGGIDDLLRRYARGGGYQGAANPPVYVDEWGNVVVQMWRLGIPIGHVHTLQDTVNFLLWVDPNVGGGIDPAPLFLTGGQGLVVPRQ